MITLPREPLPPSQVWPRVLFLYGQRKVGKTTALSQLENCLIISTDRKGAEYTTSLRVQVDNIKEYREVCDEIVKQGKPYKFVALDTVTTFDEWMEAVATKDYKDSPQGKKFDGPSVLTLLAEGGFSPGYLWLRLAFQREIRLLMRCADNIILVGHLKDKYLKSFDTKEKGKEGIDVYSRDIDLTGKIKSMTTTDSDAIGFLYRTINPSDNSERLWVSFKTNEGVNCGARATHLAGQNFPFDWNKIYPPLSKT